MIETVKDQKGNDVVVGSLPGIGTKLIINGNMFRVCYIRRSPYRITLELLKKDEEKRIILV